MTIPLHQQIYQIDPDQFSQTLDELTDLLDVRTFTDESIIRYGVVRHGQLGWTASDLLSGRNHHHRQRRSDGAPLIEN